MNPAKTKDDHKASHMLKALHVTEAESPSTENYARFAYGMRGHGIPQTGRGGRQDAQVVHFTLVGQ